MRAKDFSISPFVHPQHPQYPSAVYVDIHMYMRTPPRGRISADIIWGKNIKRGTRKRGDNSKKGKILFERVKYMQRGKLRPKGRNLCFGRACSGRV
jgi:hypothetical protein